MKLLNKVNNFFVSLSTFKFIVTITVSMFLCSFILGVILDILGIRFSGTSSYTSQAPLVSQFILAVIISPILETFLFQKCLIKILRKIDILRRNNLMVVIISALIFGSQHFYDLGYIINTTIIGIFLSYSFVTYENKKISPFYVVCIIHSLKNFISFIIVCVLKWI